MTSAHAASGEFGRGRLLQLDFECLHSLPEGINEVRVWWSDLLGREQVGKRMDISAMDADTLPEAATLMSIRHRNVVPINTAAVVSGFPSPMRVVEIVTPYYPRGSVTDALLQGERFTCSEAVAVTQAALRGLSELHEVHGILHRDVKSGNVLLTDDGSTARIADLGLAAKLDQHGTASSAPNPTIYTPPEWFDEGRLRRQSDIYGVGLVLRELVGGPFPYEKYTTTLVTDRLAKQLCPLLTADMTLPVWTPRDLRRIIRKAHARDWRQRYASAAEMDAALARAQIADWAEVKQGKWQAPRRHHPGQAVQVETRMLRDGRIRMSLLQLRKSWRRIGQDVDVATLDSVDARAVFDKATAIAAAH